MSALTWDAFSSPTNSLNRQRQRRRITAQVRREAPVVQVVPAEAQIKVQTAQSLRGKKWLGWSLAVAGVVGLHLAIAALWKNAPSAPLPAKEKIVVEIVKPQEPEKVEPPKPLPQKLTPPPKHVPRIVQPRPAPAPAPAPVVKQESLPPNTPTIAAPPTPPAPVAAPVQETVTQPIGYAGYLHNPPPAYPANAQRMGMEGKVILRVKVLASGKPASVEIQTSSGKKMLDEAAVAAVQGWMFTPSHRGQTPIDGWATVPIEFKLERS